MGGDEQKIAVALGYRQDRDRAPKVLAAGRGELAQRIISQAVSHQVPLHEDRELAELLSLIPPGGEVPEELYAAVAEVLAFVYALGSKRRDLNRG